MFIEIYNLLWAFIGSILNYALASSDKRGAINDCMRDFGMNYCLMAYVFIMLGYVQIVRMGIYLVCIMYK